MKRIQLPNELQVNTVEQGQHLVMQQLALHIKPSRSWLFDDSGHWSLMDTEAAEFWLADYKQQQEQDPETFNCTIKIYPAFSPSELLAMLDDAPEWEEVEGKNLAVWLAGKVIRMLSPGELNILHRINKRYETLCKTTVNN